MRWNWLALASLGSVEVLIGVAEVLVGAMNSSNEPTGFMIMGATFIVVGFVVRRWYKHYEVEAMATAAKELETSATQPDD